MEWRSPVPAPAKPPAQKSKGFLHALATTQVSRGLATAIVLSTLAVSTAVGAAVHLAALLDSLGDEVETHPIAISSRRIEFGRVPLHGRVIRHLVLRNDGDDAVQAWFFASGPGYLVAPRRMLLEPGVEATVAISAAADRPGPLDGELLVHVDDGAGPLVIKLAGEAAWVGEGSDEPTVAAFRAPGPPGSVSL